MLPDIDIKGRVALVTGASRGIGRAVAERLAAHGVDLLINAREESRVILGELADSLAGRYGVRCLAYGADVADSKAVSDMHRYLFKEFGRLDILINNAGILGDGLLGMISDDSIQRTLAVNVAGAINNLQMASRLMQRSGGGAVVSISSIIGLRGNPGQVVYGASKAAIVGMTLSAAKELGSRNIRVNAIAPGYIATDMIKHLDAETHAARLASIPAGRVGSAEEVADVALFLVSDLARYVTGQVIGVDGGMVI